MALTRLTDLDMGGYVHKVTEADLMSLRGPKYQYLHSSMDARLTFPLTEGYAVPICPH